MRLSAIRLAGVFFAVMFFFVTMVGTSFAQDADLRARVTSVEEKLAALSSSLEQLIAVIDSNSNRPAVERDDDAGSPTGASDDEQPSGDTGTDDKDTTADQIAQQLAEQLAKHLEKIDERLAAVGENAKQLKALQIQVDALEKTVLEASPPDFSSMINESPKNFDDAVHNSIRGRVAINNVSGQTRYVAINGRKWRVRPGRGVAYVTPSEPLQIEFDLDGGEVFTFYPREWVYRNGRYEMNLTMR